MLAGWAEPGCASSPVCVCWFVCGERWLGDASGSSEKKLVISSEFSTSYHEISGFEKSLLFPRIVVMRANNISSILPLRC